MFIVLIVLVLLAAIAWLVALLAAVKLFGLRQDGIGPATMIFDGMAWFRAATFKPEAATTHQVFRRAFAAFFVAVILLAGGMILAQA